jgi:hypothetical protein
MVSDVAPPDTKVSTDTIVQWGGPGALERLAPRRARLRPADRMRAADRSFRRSPP